MNKLVSKKLLLVEDHIEQSELLKRWIEKDTGARVLVAHSSIEALEIIKSTDIDVLVSDIELPGLTGIELATEAKRRSPFLAVALMTAHSTFEHAVLALRANVDDFWPKPMSRQELSVKIKGLIDRSEKRVANGRQRVLAIGAHPDDIEIGCGGILLRHVAANDKVGMLVLSDGECGGDPLLRTDEANKSAKVLGADLFRGGLLDTEMGNDQAGLIKVIEEVIKKFKPDVVYTHSSSDTHQDHIAVHRATLIASRQVKNVFCYQSPSATVEFRPSVFIDVTNFMSPKLGLIREHQSQEFCGYLQDHVIRSTAQYWGRFAEQNLVEPLEVIRSQGVKMKAG